MTILILSNRHDAHVNFVLPELENRGLKYMVVCMEEYPHAFTLETKMNSALEIQRIDSIDLSEVTSIWYRRPIFPEIKNKNPLYKQLIADEIEGYLSFFFTALKGKTWVSYPPNIELARNKILQLQFAKEEGLTIPETLITTKFDSFKEFYEKHKGRVIIKGIRGGWYDKGDKHNYLLFTSLLDESKLPTKESLSMSPCLFQEYVEKKLELRVSVFGNKAFTAALHSQERESSKIDWRLGSDTKLRHTIYDLPREIEEKLIKITKKFGLNFGAYDLIVTPQEEYVFLELNPNGQWGWIQEKTGLPLRESLVDLLQQGTR